jgi:hypothetical protein
VNSNDHRSTKFELLLYKEVDTMTGGDREQHELLVLRKGLRMTRMSASGHQKAAIMELLGGILEEEEGIVHNVYTAP